MTNPESYAGPGSSEGDGCPADLTLGADQSLPEVLQAWAQSMNVLVGMSSLLLETDLTRDQRDQAGTIRKGAESLLIVINESLDFSRMEAGKLAIDPADFEVDAVVEEVSSFLSQQSDQKALELTCFVAPEVPAYLYGDGSRVRLVMTDLAGNAIQFTERREVNLRVLMAGHSANIITLRFEVQDTGIGILPEVESRLAISKRLVEMMGGTIGIDSELGKGSTIWFQIPFEPARETRAPETSSVPVFAGVRVLVVDDNETSRSILKRQLESWDMKPELAGDALQAMTIVRESAIFGRPFGLMVVDYGMAGMNGIDVARIVRADSNIAFTPMIMLTSRSERREAEAAKDVGMNVYLAKPASRRQLHRAISAILPTPSCSGERIRIPAKAGLEDLIPGYLDNCREQLLMLSQAVAGADLDAARVIGHGMKGCGLGYGFAAITEIGAGIEQSARGNDAAGVSAQIVRLEDFLSRVDVAYK